MYVNFLSTYSNKKSCHTSTTLQTSIARFSCSYPLAFDSPIKAVPVGILPSRLVWKKLEWWGYPMVPEYALTSLQEPTSRSKHPSSPPDFQVPTRPTPHAAVTVASHRTVRQRDKFFRVVWRIGPAAICTLEVHTSIRCIRLLIVVAWQYDVDIKFVSAILHRMSSTFRYAAYNSLSFIVPCACTESIAVIEGQDPVAICRGVA